jgi:predicted nucleic acid-binding protein
LVRERTLSLHQARQLMQETESFMQDRDYEVSSSHVLTLCAASRCSAYDCEFVALAQQLGVSLVTSDQQVLSDFPDLAIPLKVFGVPPG